MSKYVILSETNGDELETWYYFIKYNGNEKTLKYLNDQLNNVEDMYIIDNFSSFDLDLDHTVSEQTAKEMTKVELNSQSFHRKFDGKLGLINLGIRKKKDNNEAKIIKVHRMLSFGQIEDYISDEDIDTEDLMTDDESTDDDEIIPPPLSSDEEDEDEEEKAESEEEKEKEKEKGKEKVENEGKSVRGPVKNSQEVKNIPRNKRKKKKRY